MNDTEALRLAKLIERDYYDETLAPRKAAAELRRLHAENETLKKIHKESLYYAMGQAAEIRALSAKLMKLAQAIEAHHGIGEQHE